MTLARGIGIAVIVVVGSYACSSQYNKGVPALQKEGAAALHDSALGTGDVFAVTVYGQEDLSGEYQVGGEGDINFPLLGRVEVSGMEPNALARNLATELRERGYLVDPHVSINVVESNSRRVSVMGAVAKPSTFPFVPGMTVVQAVSIAGGFSSLADHNSTVLTRRTNGELKRYRIPVAKISSGQFDDVPLRPGDLIFVPERVF